MNHGRPSLNNFTNEKINYKVSFKFLLNRIKPYRLFVLLAIAFSITSVIASTMLPTLLGNVTDDVISKLVNSSLVINLTKSFIFIIILLVISAITQYLNGFIMSHVNKKVCQKMRQDLNRKINKLPLTYFDKTNNGEILSFTTNDIDMISSTLTQYLIEIISSITTFIVILIMMIKISGILTLTIGITVPIFLIILFLIVGKSQKYFKQQQDYLGHINGHVEEMYSAHEVTTLYNNQKKSVKKLKDLNDTLYNSAWKSNFLTGLFQPLMMAFSNLGFVLTCIVGGYLTVKGRISIGNIQAFITYARNFSNPLTSIASMMGTIQQAFAATYRIQKFLNEEDEVETGTLKLNDKNIKGNITFENISFGYNPEKIIIKDFSINIKQGEKIAIVGPTGAGKTTIVKLLMRFYELNEGKILLDNIALTDIKKDSLRNEIGMVLQDTWLFEGTVKENLIFGKPDATQKEIEEAVKEASLSHIIHTLPNNYNFVINEETTNISEGEKQLITIARTFLRNPKILILDEATSNIDTRTEILIQKALESLMKNKTTFIIAHRLSTIINADKIIVMNEGNIVEVGNHNELIKKDGFYSKLYNSQFEK